MKHGKYRYVEGDDTKIATDIVDRKALDAFEMIQTTRLLASRDFMYAHAQLDFESRLMRGRANEDDNPGDGARNANENIEMANLSDRVAAAHQIGAGEEGELALVRKDDNPYFYHIGVTGYFNRLRQLGTEPRCRRALVCASVAMISQQMTGVNTIGEQSRGEGEQYTGILI